MPNHSENTIVVGVDPAPSKGLCVYAVDPKEPTKGNGGFERHYPATIDGVGRFAGKVMELIKNRPLLICWDAPLTMPEGDEDFYGRGIEKVLANCRKEQIATRRNQGMVIEEGGSASVQRAAGCSHWAISQKVVGFPKFADGSLPGALLAPVMIEEERLTQRQPLENGVYVAEVHPALALQMAHGSALRRVRMNAEGLPKEDSSWKLSGSPSYKTASWGSLPATDDERSGFSILWQFSKNFNDGIIEPLPLPTEGIPKDEQPGPSDHLDAWVAMRLGVRWLKKEGVRLYGNSRIGSFLLPIPERAHRDERKMLAKIRKCQSGR